METKKTKLQIIEETVDFYSTDPVGRRGVRGSFFGYAYQTGQGKKCAVGRCLVEGDYILDLSGTSDDMYKQTDSSKVILEDILKLEYKGHDSIFWRQLQLFHDTYNNWDGKGLTKQGEERLKKLKTFYGYNN